MENFTLEKQFENCKKCLNRKRNYTDLSDICNIKGQKKEFTDFCQDFDLDKRAASNPDNNDGELLSNENRDNFIISSTDEKARVLTITIWIVMVLEIVSIYSSILQYNILDKLKNGIVLQDSVLNGNDNREQTIALIYLIVFIISAIFFIRWFRNSYRNLYARGVNLKHNESWTIWSWFVPILNIFRPYQMMKDMFEKSDQLIKLKNPDYVLNKKSIVGVWWTIWLINNYVGKYAFKANIKGETIDDFMLGTFGDIANSIIGIVLAIVTINMIKNYQDKESKMQTLN